MADARHQYWLDRPLEITVEGDSKSQLTLPQPYALVGSDTRCDVVLPDRTLPARCYVVCLTSSGLLGATLAHPRSNVTRQFQPINAERGVRFGRRRLTFHVDDLTSVPERLSKEKTHFIRWTDNDRKHFTRLSAGRVLLLGREAPSAVRINDASISSVHAAIYHDGVSLWVIDLNSTNGTFIRGEQVRCGVVEQGHSFCVGSTKIRFGRDRKRDAKTSTDDVTQTIVLGEVSRTVDDSASSLSGLDVISTDSNQTNKMQETDLQHQHALADLANRLALSESELTAKNADIAALMGQLADAEAERAKLVTQLEEQNDLQARQATATKELAEQRLQLATQREQLDLERQQLQSDRDAQRAEQQSAKTELETSRSEFEERVASQGAAICEEREKLDQAYAQLTHDRNELERCSLEVAAKLKQTKIEIKQQQAANQRESELLVVNRIRTQRGLESREAAIVTAEAELERRQVALLALEQRVQRQQDEFLARQRRYVPPEDGLVRSPVQVVDEPAAPNSLLESADFTELLKDFVGETKRPNNAK